MATHARILARIIPWAEEPGGLNPWGCKVWDVAQRLSTCVHTCKLLAVHMESQFPDQGWNPSPQHWEHTV